MSDTREPRNLNSLEDQLRDLQPETQLSKDELLFRAGQASASKLPHLKYPIITAVVGILFGIFLGRMYSPQPVRVITKIVRVKDPVLRPVQEKGEDKAPEKNTPAEAKQLVQHRELPHFSSGYLGLRDQVLRWGPGVLPSLRTSENDGEDKPSATWLNLQKEFMDTQSSF